MTQAVENILTQAERLSPSDQAELADRLIEAIGKNIPPEIQQAQLAETKRRLGEIENGQVMPIPGHQALSQVRKILSDQSKAS